MLTKIQNIFQFILDQVYNSIETPKRNDAELTKSSWAEPIKSYADVPDVYKDFFDSFLAHGREFPYVVLTPSYENFIHKTSEKLICDGGCEIVVLEKSGNTFETQHYPLEGIIYVEFRIVLLDASFKICGVTGLGVQTTSTFKFNSVTDYLFSPFLRRIRLAGANSTQMVQSKELEKFDNLYQRSYKFMNYGKRSLLGGEQVLHIYLQTEIREPILKFIGKALFKRISPTHMSILTDREFILIQEEETRSGKERYGGIWSYIPLRKISSLTLREKTDHLLGLTIWLTEDMSLELLYQDSAREELNQLLGCFKAITAR
jgi:hypothetical protein